MITEILAALFESKAKAIDDWFEHQYQKAPRCFYSSVDIRDAGFKMAPVDTNLFPAGFNNLTKQGEIRAASYIKDYVTQYYPEAKRLLLIPENHSRNNFYFANVAMIKKVTEDAGYEVKIGLITEDSALLKEIQDNAPELQIEKVERQGNILTTNNDIADLIILNTDLTSGIPAQLSGLEQPIIPSLAHGWHIRTKSNHFSKYDKILDQFCQEFSIDKFLLSAIHFACGKVDFREKTGIECVAIAVDKAIYHIQQKYNEYSIADKPYVYIKAERGTYGMGIMTASSGEDIYDINKKLRNKMDTIKEGVTNSEVIVQEGIRTISKIENMVAEPLIYLANGEVIDCFFRANSEKDELSNLNSRGAKILNDYDYPKEKIQSYQLVARLAALAAANEI